MAGDAACLPILDFRNIYAGVFPPVTLDALLSSFTTMFVVVDPIGLAPIFLALTFGMSQPERRKVAIQAAMIAFFVLVAAAFGGAWLLSQLGISIPAFRIAGGLLLFVIAFEMVFGRRTDRKIVSSGVTSAHPESENIAAFPLAIPLMAGPGAITASVILSGNAAGDPIALLELVGIDLTDILYQRHIETIAWHPPGPEVGQLG
jgi:multiple antibiotic resistance protein